MKLRPLFVMLAVAALSTPASAVILYDGSQGTLPADQGWIYLTKPLFSADATQAIDSDATVLDTTITTSDSAGYFGTFHPLLPTMDRADGVTVEFDAQLEAESHGNANRAGFSVIALSDDLFGIELGFWIDEIWAQSGPNFQHAEGVLFDTTTDSNHYQLDLHDDQYALVANGLDLLTGPLRDYSSFGLPYSSPNFLFLGDDTSSADARLRLSRIEITTGTNADTSVPEPTGLVLVLTAILGLVGLRRVAWRLTSGA